MSRRIALFGGTFNPVHIGHLAIAERAREYFRLDTVLFVPTKRPPHKKFEKDIADSTRFKLLEQAVSGNNFFSILDYEFRQTEKTYSINTVRYVQKRYPGATLFFLIGEDHLGILDTWKDIETLIKTVTFIMAGRKESANAGSKTIQAEQSERTEQAKPSSAKNGTRLEDLQKKVERFPAPELAISSSMIREYCQRGQSVRYLLPDSVWTTIVEQGLYNGKTDTQTGPHARGQAP